MAQLDLTEREQEVLRDALESYLRELHEEIVHTDAREMRDDLKAQQKTLEAVLGRLAAGTAKPAR
jgi:hypothetical protein